MTYRNFWQGPRIRLRGIEPEDAEVFHTWNLDSETARLVDFMQPPESLAGVKAWTQKVASARMQDDKFEAAMENEEGVLVGIINTHAIDRRVGAFRYGLAVRPEYRGRGYASEAIILVLRYYFEELRYQKVNATVYSYNPASMRLHEKLGFLLEGRLRRIIYTRGQYYDELYYGMTAEEFAAAYGSSATE
jgi:RimJ/RimL family protein N-acetyltransferase